MSNVPDPESSRRADDSVFDARDWLQITLSSIGDGVITADRDGRVNYLNPVAETLTGWTLADATGVEVEQVFRIINESTREPVEQPVRKVIERGLTVGLGNHTLLVARDGSERPIDDSAAAIKDVQPTLEPAEPWCRAVQAACSLNRGLTMAPGPDPESASGSP